MICGISLCAAVSCPLLFLQMLNSFSYLCYPNSRRLPVPAYVSLFYATTRKLSHISKRGSCGARFIHFPSLELQSLLTQFPKPAESFFFFPYVLSSFFSVILDGKVYLVLLTPSCLEAEVVSSDI